MKGGTAVDEVRYLLLGPMEVVVDGEPAPLPGPAERALLAHLLLSAGRTIPTTALVDRLWSGSSLPVDPVNALQIRVSKLRRALGALGLRDVVVRHGTGYRADVEPQQVDAIAFSSGVARARAALSGVLHPTEAHLAAYDDALALWRGEALADFGTEPWAAVEAGRLTELRLAALTERAQVALGLGRAPEVVADLEPWVATDPTLESLVGLLMVALYRAGRQADALEAYHRTRTVLDESLGLEPSLTLRSLHERVLRQDPSLGEQADLAPPAVAAPRVRVAETSPLCATTLSAAVPRPLLGRDDQLGALVELVGEARLLTLVGPGGAGKTSLALALAARVSDSFADGVHGVRLAAVASADQVPWAVAEALGVPLDGAAPDGGVRSRLAAFLSGRRALVLLDNCEHVVDAVAALVDEVLATCPHVTVLATSREALALREEVQVTVGPLEVPPTGAAPAEVLSFPAAQLFAERARSVAPAAVSSDTDLAAVASIACALDGMPLALELAAARVTTLSPSEIAARLGHRFDLLTSGSRTAEARQRTLRATVDWSYDLLTEAERRVFDRLAVFHGGWTLEAAEAVLGGDDLPSAEVLDVVGRLVHRSMVVVERGVTTRYRMLETLREYAAERLGASGDAGLLAARHARHYQALAVRCEWLLRRGGQREALRVLREEQPNIRAALAWWSGPAGDRDVALEMAGSLGLFWHLGRDLEGREVLRPLLADPSGSSKARALALQAISLVERPRACLVHPSASCARAAADSLAVFEEAGDRSRAALSKVLLAVEGVSGGDDGRHAALLEEAGAQFAAEGDAWGGAVIGFVRMETAFTRGDEEAVPIGRAAAAAFRALDDPWGESAVLYHLGWGLRQFGRHEDAARVLEEAIDAAGSAGLWNTAQWALAELGITQLDLGHRDEAARLFDRAAAASRQVGDGAGAVLWEYGRGLLAHADGDVERARLHFRSAVAGFAELRTPVMQGLALVGLAGCDDVAGASTLARDGYEQALALGRSTGEPRLTALALEGLARTARAAGEVDAAATWAAEAAALRTAARRPVAPHERVPAPVTRPAADPVGG
ncbi:BTAD domain-containing putative transcriptional regulator [Phycicoccus sp. M110.8]|uniref:BTAD domain-containing putative transcriptional regulator n=1 Tax=Phycicoccus sp. M110.8 TaxID=3075433 RepID=UPI0028FD6EC8|nr:BTAD domain-containing putative transcriptional regulator [Phycicoccus sp. M110.8]MDU0315291.1 BTAD domain-containing putative transcriptional regulator [Phycicoccus sp. M110.8]